MQQWASFTPSQLEHMHWSNTTSFESADPNAAQADQNDIWMTEEEMDTHMIKNRSVVWPHFFLNTIKNKAKCRHCPKVLTVVSKNGTNHLKRHIQRCPGLASAGQSTLDDFVTRPNTQESYNYEECSNELSRMIIQTETPFLFSEHPAFNKYVKKNQSQHKETSRKVVKSKAMAQYCNNKQELISDFANNTCRFNITADGWDSGTDYSYVCITAHWIDRDWVLQKRIIEFAKLEFPHNATNYHNIIMNGINEYGLRSKILSVTFDNATSMTAVANRLKTSLDGSLLHIRCACHVLNLSIKDGLQGLKQYHAKFKHVVHHLNTNNYKRNDYRVYCRNVGAKYRKIPLENNTRWNSTHIMLTACIESKQPLTDWWNRNYPEMPLLDEDWKNMEMYVDFLGAFLDATNSFSHVYKPTSPYFLGNIIPIAQLFSKYRGVDTHIDFLSVMETKFLKYWTDIPYVYVFAIILDPRWKLDGAISLINIYKEFMNLDFDVEGYKAEITTAFFNVYNHYESRFGNNSRNSSRASAASSSSGGGGFRGATLNALKGLVSQRRPDVRSSSTASDLAEYHMYTNYDYMRAISDDEANSLDLCQWWKIQSKALPVMSAMAKDFLSIQVSSVASERAFSASKRVLDEKRTRMNSSTLRMCVCYKDWMDASDRNQSRTEVDSDNDSDETSTESNT
ncbi:hypothetical protein RND81_06G037900 [Saponaria officinalis]|uniref:BED-type domain-containing protein n=1 Tax=Saponaria officinalis TaxID=3572 RepID=A0AAW1K7F2_SAPOF